MVPNDKLSNRIAELIARPNNVECREIEWVMNQLGASFRKTRHGILFKIPGCRSPLMLNAHNNGNPNLPFYCVADFCDRMVELGLYEPDESNDET